MAKTTNISSSRPSQNEAFVINEVVAGVINWIDRVLLVLVLLLALAVLGSVFFFSLANLHAFGPDIPHPTMNAPIQEYRRPSQCHNGQHGQHQPRKDSPL
jgi:hypothetical protein